MTTTSFKHKKSLSLRVEAIGFFKNLISKLSGISYPEQERLVVDPESEVLIEQAFLVLRLPA